ncbi:Na+/H+ antiporter NhaC family protein [Clostridium omnivorum]|uniref:Sodium:proton antiporter n=1 Tax=Clostridium omnivorum TaxID=1604902 RepID=A0ABQ5N781_9CLOT|nr:Na+/H+ antiporter NhaC family protein [Clostridium sp. E14]GLC31042.1 sodium:proton antiporter [Clostridium sp. E14]
MDIILAFIFCFVMLITSVFMGVFVGYPLILGLIIFIIIACRKGFKLLDVIKMTYRGGKKSLIVLEIFVLIGAITSSWMASGTVPAIVYYGMKFLNPKFFILSAFIISSIVSFLIGTSFGTIGTVGVALMVMARSGGVNPVIVGGAILSGAYFGDRCSPMSSSANLVAHITDTELYDNIKNMTKTSIAAFVISCILYVVFSFEFPLISSGSSITDEIIRIYNVSYLTLIPALIILVLSFFKINVKKLMALSIAAASLIAIVIQHNTIYDLIKSIIFGYSMSEASTLSSIIKGGGILSMLKIALVVFISSGFTGIFEETNMLSVVEDIIKKPSTRAGLFFTNILVSIATAAFGCSQALAVILTHLLIKEGYSENGISNSELACDIENTAIVISPLIPWNIAGLVPLTTLGVGLGAIVFSLYLFLLPILNFISLFLKDKVKTA